jgi:bile acid:Na+ symporter, BASS family
MFRKNDLLLILVVFCSMGFAIAFPKVGGIFLPFPLYLMMLMLFFSFIKIEFGEVAKNLRNSASVLFLLCLLKLAVLPVGLFFITRAIWPEYAVPVLLLSGISSGVVSPFMADILNANTLRVLMVMVVSSLLVPFTLPALVKLVAGRTIDIPFLAMVRTLAMVVFLPAIAAILFRRWFPSLVEKLNRAQYPVSLVTFACTNLGVFSKYSSYFLERPAMIAGAVSVAFVLSAIYHSIGLLATWGMKREDRLAGAISFAFMNNVVVMVFSSHFFDPLSPTLAAVYMLPFFLTIVPLRMVGNLFRD